jgi:hypothetical protein
MRQADRATDWMRDRTAMIVGEGTFSFTSAPLNARAFAVSLRARK